MLGVVVLSCDLVLAVKQMESHLTLESCKNVRNLFRQVSVTVVAWQYE